MTIPATASTPSAFELSVGVRVGEAVVVMTPTTAYASRHGNHTISVVRAP